MLDSEPFVSFAHLPRPSKGVIPFPERGDSLGESEGVEVCAKPHLASPGSPGRSWLPLAVPGRAWPCLESLGAGPWGQAWGCLGLGAGKFPFGPPGRGP